MILHELRGVGATSVKELVLSRASEEDKKIFKYAYNPTLMFYQKYKTINWDTVVEPADASGMYALLNLLATRALTGNAARESVASYSAVHGDLIKLICNKDLDCGVSATTLNKVYGAGFVAQFKVQLATEVPLNKIHFPKMAQLKYNGTRVITTWDAEGQPLFRTRNGFSFEFPQLAKALYKYCNRRQIMLDGELCFGDSKGHNHAKISGIVNSAIKGTPIPNDLGIVYNLFDAMPLADFERSYCGLAYRDRWSMLIECLEEEGTLSERKKHIDIAYTRMLHNTDEANTMFESFLAKGYEGLILKDEGHEYEFKRSKNWIKLKAIKDVTLTCDEWQEGTGKYEGAIGALLCHGTVEGKKIKVKIASGLSDNDRDKDPSYYIGKLIDIQYNEVIQNKATGMYSLFLPRFITVRGDL